MSKKQIFLCFSGFFQIQSDKEKKYPERERIGKRSGGQKGNARVLIENPDEFIELYPESCSCCGNKFQFVFLLKKIY